MTVGQAREDLLKAQEALRLKVLEHFPVGSKWKAMLGPHATLPKEVEVTGHEGYDQLVVLRVHGHATGRHVINITQVTRRIL